MPAGKGKAKLRAVIIEECGEAVVSKLSDAPYSDDPDADTVTRCLKDWPMEGTHKHSGMPGAPHLLLHARRGEWWNAGFMWRP